MKAVILLGTLKREGLSNTETLSQFFGERLNKRSIEFEIIKLTSHSILQGTYSDMGFNDAWPTILKKIENAQILIFATPVWWGNHSSEIQKVIERLDNIHDEILEGKESRLENKVAGIIITGDSDGSQHIIGNISNFLNAIGVVIPPYATLSVQSTQLAKGAKTSKNELFEIFEKEYSKAADKMIDYLLKFA
ncbi:MAG: Multimeric flavodoxin WrbA-like protein [Sphingobacteriales bacterium]|nr:Multimeric flavodoxin WrbA-like protein [Sphingobacteriales bacterium]